MVNRENGSLALQEVEIVPEDPDRDFRKGMLFVKMINCYVRAVQFMKCLKSLTERASYMFIMGSIVGIVLFYLGGVALKSYFDALHWILIYTSRADDLKKLRKA